MHCGEDRKTMIMSKTISDRGNAGRRQRVHVLEKPECKGLLDGNRGQRSHLEGVPERGEQKAEKEQVMRGREGRGSCQALPHHTHTHTHTHTHQLGR